MGGSSKVVNNLCLLGIICVCLLNYVLSEDQHDPHRSFGLSRAGICHLEVPTIDLISQDQRSGHIPAGNGSKAHLSRIEVCCSGWTRKPHNHFECEPICEKGCENGNCTAPNVCACKKGYVKNELDICTPTCPIGCNNGVCTTQGYCSCNAGFESSRDGKYCVATCRQGCGPGGVCIGADRCNCGAGYTFNVESRRCEHHCEGGCAGGTCVGPNQCQCPSGFIKSGTTCVPECRRGCKNGHCVAPEVCRCDGGWSLDKTGAICEPHCDQPCLNADCTGPNVCTCKHGYTKDPTRAQGNKCVADCPGGCPNGSCTAPNFCICNPGFAKERKGSNNCIRRMRKREIMWDLIPQQD